MFQKDLLFPWRSVQDNAALGLEVTTGDRGAARRQAHELLPRFGLEGFEHHRPSELSGGMRQRVALLRTLLLRRPLLLLDEPFASLDALTRRELQAWLRDTWRLGSEAAVLVTHDVREAVLLSDRVYVMSPRPGHIVAEIAVEHGPDGIIDATRLARAEESVMQALNVQHVAV
jgi:ABC-type nitrate/sulfonate/bicarbonate transport system ATPase subunit